jgi:hypothetical protein
MAEDVVKYTIKAEDKSAKVLDKVKSNILGLNKAVLGIGAAIVGAAGLGSLVAMTKSAMDTADKIHKLTQRTGASAEALSQYRHVADLSGVAFSQFTDGIEKMSRNVADAAQDTGTAKDALEELGISAADLMAQKPEAMFEILAEALNQVKNSSDRTRLAMDIFGRSGGVLLQMMTGGAEGLREMRQEADNLGMTMSTKMVEDVAKADDAITRITNRFSSLSEHLAGALAPDIEKVATEMGNWIEANQEWIDQNFKKAIEDLTITAKALVPLFQAIWQVIEFTGDKIGWLAFKISQLNEMMDGKLLDTLTGGRMGLMESVQKMGAAPAAADQPGTAAYLAAHGGGEPMDAGFWQGSGGGQVVNNFNTQLTRSDAVAIATESARRTTRQ